jgi:GR25 family glycosyltransferase involved in LPS biosynthesis
MGLQAYVIKPEAARKLINDVKTNGYYPADIQCNKGIIKIETIYPSLASVNPRFYGNKKLMKQESTTQKKW